MTLFELHFAGPSQIVFHRKGRKDLVGVSEREKWGELDFLNFPGTNCIISS